MDADDRNLKHDTPSVPPARARSLARRCAAVCVGALRALGAVAVALYLAFGAFYLATRYWLMPRIDQWRPQLEAVATATLGVPVRIARIDSEWRGIHPHLRLTDVRLYDAGGAVVLALPLAEATVSWTSLVLLEPRFERLAVYAPELEIRRLAEGRFEVAGITVDLNAPRGDGRLLDWLLAQQRVAIRDLRLRYVDLRAGTAAQTLLLEEGDLEYRRGLLLHRLALRGRPPAELAAALDLRLEFRPPPLARLGDVSRWSGRVFVQTEYADVAQLATLAGTRLPFTLDRAQGALRAWIDFDRLRSVQLLADVAAADVSLRLAADFPPLALAHVRGRIAQRQLDSGWDGGQELTLSELTVQTTDGPAMGPMNLRLRWAAQRGELQADRLQLDALVQLAHHLPLPPSVRGELNRRAPRGELTALRANWQAGASYRYALRTRFTGLSLRAVQAQPQTTADGLPQPGVPGFENLTGSLTLTEAGGQVQIDAAHSALEFPGVFAVPRIAARELKLVADWSLAPQLELRFQSIFLRNDDLELTANGSWREAARGPGVVDLTGRIARLRAAAAHRYAPLVLNADVRAWLAAAFSAGEAVDGSFRLRGDLYEFPFASGDGDFRVQARLRDVTLEYLSGWPAARDVAGDLRVERARMQFSGRQVRVFDTHVMGLELRIDDLQKDARLTLTLRGDGPAADVVRYLNEAPLGRMLDGLFGRAAASGRASLELALAVPLNDARETRANGTVTFHSADVALRPEWPPLTRASGRIEFSERGLRLLGVSAAFLGGQVSVEGGMRSDGAIALSLNGTATAAGIRQLLGDEGNLLAHAQGLARYTATVLLRDGRPDIRVESDLVGWSLALPEPLAKSAHASLPLRVAIVPEAGSGDRVRASLGNVLALELQRRDAGNRAHVERGLVHVGAAAALAGELPERGIRLTVDLPFLNADRWLAVLGSGSGSVRGQLAPDLVAARIGELMYGGRPITNLVIGATRSRDGADTVWLANAVSDHATGSFSWRMPRGDSPGHISARLARLVIAEPNRDAIVDVLDAPARDFPALDVVVDHFEVGSRQLGRLELVAQNVGTGETSVWQLQRLEITNADGRMSATGRWAREPGSSARTMALDLALQFSDAGRLLTRLGIAEAVRGGAGTLAGQVHWRGTPLAIDYTTLSGHLTLSVQKGQFLKADAGAARLLGVLSLQALPRRLALDFRDVFSEGFAFDTISASADIAGGVLSTRDFRMRGAQATVLLEGSADLRAETQNLHVLVLPAVDLASASLVYALLANPAIGLGTFLAQLLLRDPLAKAFSFEYEITGTWQDPQVRRRERAAAGTGEVSPDTR
ncbi:MAG: YhdP family protein [Sutterellaceae bacterium]|nr:YhdP family protein [Burkholderiaceae bacterium]MDW8429956.1 YhdP family protein [Sutterellaceae bacterium]